MILSAIDAQEEKPLIVISSDMNHFADDATNRELDALALDELRGGNPRGLFDVCIDNKISMCGMRPAIATMGALRHSASIAPEIIAYDTSASTNGDKSRVVGYAGALIV